MTTQDLIAAAQERGGRLIIVDFPDGEPRMSVEPHEGTRATTPAELAEAQNGALKLFEWSKLVDISVRELQRATGCGALPSHRKKKGRDAGALQVSPGDMAEYLRLCAAVQAGHHEPPSWWHEVRLGQAGKIRHAT